MDNLFVNLLFIFLIIIVFILGLIVMSEPSISDKIKDLGEFKTEVITNENEVELIKIVDDKVIKLLVEMLSDIIRVFNEDYKTLNLIFKKFVYEIINDLEDLKNKVEDNKLEEIDMKKLREIISIFIENVPYKIKCEKIMFEWDKKYMNYKDYGESPFYYIKK
ncbi:MAG: hypothetical protein NSGCLCUN01_02699 [uncultured Clostridium sp.]